MLSLLDVMASLARMYLKVGSLIGLGLRSSGASWRVGYEARDVVYGDENFAAAASRGADPTSLSNVATKSPGLYSSRS